MPGAARQQVTLFCLPKIQVTKQKGTHLHRPYGLPSVFLKDRAAAELGLWPQTVLADYPRPGCAARLWTKGTENLTPSSP